MNHYPIYEHLGTATVARFWSKASIGDPVDCWTWTGTPSQHGYGAFWIPQLSQTVRPHRVALTIRLGRDIGPGLQAGHTCHDRAAAAGACPDWPCIHRLCVNPNHLTEMTNRENQRASANTITAQQVARTHCPFGHPLEVHNLTPSGMKRGDRGCLTCNRRRARERYALIRAARLAMGMTVKTYVTANGQGGGAATAHLIRLGIDPDAVLEAAAWTG